MRSCMLQRIDNDMRSMYRGLRVGRVASLNPDVEKL